MFGNQKHHVVAADCKGETLIKQETMSETLFIVNSGLFEVRFAGGAKTVAKIGVGQPIGEIGFF